MKTQIFQTLLLMAVVIGVVLSAPTPNISELKNVSQANDSSTTEASAGYNGLTSTGVPLIPVAGGYVDSGKTKVSHSHGGVGDHGCGFIDKIFDIPMEILQVINKYLNKKHMHLGQAGIGANFGKECNGTSENGKPETPMITQKNENYDDLFNIPITALRSVRNMLSSGWMMWKNYYVSNNGVN